MIDLRRGLHTILAEAILISVLLSSIAIYDIFYIKSKRDLKSDIEASLVPVGCVDNVAILECLDSGPLYMERDSPLELRLYSERTGWLEFSDRDLPLLKEGDILVIKFKENKGFVRLANIIVYYDKSANQSICYFARID